MSYFTVTTKTVPATVTSAPRTTRPVSRSIPRRKIPVQIIDKSGLQATRGSMRTTWPMLSAAKKDRSAQVLTSAPAAIQEARPVARTLAGDLAGRPREPFRYRDKGKLATIGRSRAIADLGRLRFAGFPAWVLWLVVHIYFLVGFKNRLFVVLQWAWAYLAFRRGARLIVARDWRAGDGA